MLWWWFCFTFHIYVRSYGIRLCLTYFPQHDALKVHPHRRKWMGTGCCHVVATVNNVTVTVGVPMSLDVMFLFLLDVVPPVKLLAHRVVLFLTFLRNLYTVFHSGRTRLNSANCTRAPFSLLSHQHLLSLDFVLMATSASVSFLLLLHSSQE